MWTPDLVSTFLRPLNRAGVSYMVTGSVAATIYGEPRFTQDVDIVLSLSTRDAAVLADAFSPSHFYCAWADRLGVSKQWRDVESRMNRQRRSSACVLASSS